MSAPTTYRVKQAAHIAGVSVRTLHYYDELGLLVPSQRTRAGYRLYTEDDLLRLQQIVIQRELGFSLEQIRRWLDEPGFDRRSALREQRAQLAARAERTREMLAAVDYALAAIESRARGQRGTSTIMDMDAKRLFAGFDPAEHEAEARARWGHTDAFKISAARTRRYSERDWQAIKDEQADIYRAAAQAMAAGIAAEAPEAMDIAERHRLSIDRWFYPCGHAHHVGLADLYTSDARFAANLDKVAEGLTPYLAAAIRANARRQT